MDYYIGLLFSITSAISCAYIAKKKQRNIAIWFIAGMLVTIFALILLILLPDLDKQEAELIPTLSNIKDHTQSNPTLNSNLSNKLWYYLDGQNHQKGPISIQRLMEELKDGKIKPNTFVWNDELTDWKPLEETSDYQLFHDKKS